MITLLLGMMQSCKGFYLNFSLFHYLIGGVYSIESVERKETWVETVV